MPGPRQWWLRLQSLVNRARVEGDLNDEIRDYLEREMEREIAAGWSPEEARRRARSALGGIERLKEDCRDARGVRWLEDFFSDLRFACRTLRKAPLFTLAVVAALALCIGFNAAIFAVVDAALFRPLPFPDQGRLVSVTEGVPSMGYPVMPVSCPDYLFVAANNRSFAATAAYQTQQYEMSGAGQPQRVQGARVTASLFPVLGVSALVGRAFTQEEDDGLKRVAVLNYGFAQTWFGTPQRALGETILLNRIPYQVIGIMPRSFSFPIRGSRFNDHPAAVFVPVSWGNQDRTQTASNFDYSMIARLRPNVAVQQSDAEVRGLVKEIVEKYPTKVKQIMQRWAHFSLESQTVPFRTEFSGDVQRPLLLLMAAAGIVLLIGCADVANLMLSRMAGRQREFALRTALGAGNGRLARQTLTEGLFLSAMGGAIGFSLAYWTLPILVRLAPDTLPRLNEAGVNWRITVFSAAVTLATPLILCLAPILDTMRPAAVDRLRGEGRTSTQSKRQRRLMSGAMIMQFSLAFLLLTADGLLLRSFIRASEANPGFQPEHVLSMRIALPPTTYRTPPQIANLFDRLLARLSALPGVQRAGAISELPTGSSSDVVLSIEGRGGDSERADTFSCLGEALDALRLQLLKGRLLRPEDYAGPPHAAVISASLARRVWRNDEEAIGKRVKFGVDDPMNDQPWLTVVGVVSDVKAKLTSNAPRLALFTTSDHLPDTMDVVVRTPVDPLSLASALRYEVSRLDPHLPAGGIQTVDRILNESLSPERFRTWLLSVFAIAAMLLATLGIAGLLAYNAAQRMQEFGLRAALGASRRNLIGLVLRDCLRTSGTGIAVGFTLSLAATRILSALLYDTSPLDPATFLAVAALLLLVAIGAAVFPAWRVIHADTIAALRAE